MFERFTDRARRVVTLSIEEARRLGHAHVGTEHILLALFGEPEGVAARTLASLGISSEQVRSEVVDDLPPGDARAPKGHLPFTPRSKKILELSLREALSLGHNYIGTEHILLGLVREGEGKAAQVLSKLGADENTMRDEVIHLLIESKASSQTSPVGKPNPEDMPACPGCRVVLADHLAVKQVTATGRPGDRTVLVYYCSACGRALGMGAAGSA